METEEVRQSCIEERDSKSRTGDVERKIIKKDKKRKRNECKTKMKEIENKN